MLPARLPQGNKGTPKKFEKTVSFQPRHELFTLNAETAIVASLHSGIYIPRIRCRQRHCDYCKY